LASQTENQNDKSRTQRLRAQQAEDGKRAMAEYLANATAVRAKTERLRALRMAQEEAQEEAAAKAPPPKPAKTTATKPVKRVRKTKTSAA
jgi:hypothetical protein